VAPDLATLLLRIALIGGLYLFLLAVVIVVARDLGRGGGGSKAAASRPGRLVVVGADESVPLAAKVFDLQPASTIGRDDTCAVTIPDTFVSSTHALLAWRDGKWWIEDLGSTNGTQLNNRGVKTATPVAFNDVIQVGRVRLKLSRE
jgi:hypothetical protein